MKVVKFNYIDYFNGGKPGGLGEILDKYNIPNELSDEPDYIIHFPYGDDYLNYDCVRIFWTGENVSPDFNLSDYAIGFDYLNFGDRYFRYPLYLEYVQDWERAVNKHKIEGMTDTHLKFCNFVYSNSKASKERGEFFELLNRYKRVDSGGKYKNNLGYLIDDKYIFQKNYKFSIAFENASTPGYTTEKIVQAFAARTVPIYWGNPLISREFNTKAFINCHDYGSFEEVIEVIKKVDSDDELFWGYLNAPMLTAEQEANVNITKREFEKFIVRIFSQPKNEAFRRNRGYWVRENYENKMKRQLLEMDARRMRICTLGGVILTMMRERGIQIRHKLHLGKESILKRKQRG